MSNFYRYVYIEFRYFLHVFQCTNVINKIIHQIQFLNIAVIDISISVIVVPGVFKFSQFDFSTLLIKFILTPLFV